MAGAVPNEVASGRRLGPRATAALRAAVALAGGREVYFAATLDPAGVVDSVRVVARGGADSVLALPGFAERGEMMLHNHPSGRLDPSDADLAVAARIHEDGIGFGIIDNAATTLYVVVEVPREKSTVRLVLDDVRATLAPDGLVAQHLARYEDRESQRDMAAAIARLYNGGGIGLFEAGTGVGKSLGYLVPALRWAAANGERTIVSTNTINLQEQLVGKDLPFLAGALTDQKVRFALLKGWRNYVCLQRLEQAAGHGASLFDGSVTNEIDTLRSWAAGTSDGSLADLPSPPSPDVWDEVAAEPDLCGRLKCPHYARCFVFAARRRAADSDVIVVNHHLLLADLAVRRVQQNWGDAAVLPAYRRLVVDEGHHLEDAAASHLGTSVTRRGLERLLSRLERRGGRGLLALLAARLAGREDLYSTASHDLVTARLIPVVPSARDSAATVFALLDTVLADTGEPVYRLTEEFDGHPLWRGGLDAALADLLSQIGLLRDGLRLVRDRLEIDVDGGDPAAALVREISGVVRRLEAFGDGLARALRPPSDGPPTVRWLESRGRDRNLAATAVPLDLAPILREDLFARLDTAIVTSATLAAGDDFTYLTTRLGLTEDEVEPETAVFPSPFDFAEQALLVVPTDVPVPNVDPPGHLRACVEVVRAMAHASDGGLFALFTSHRDVRAAAAALRACPDGTRWPLLVHGEDARDALLRRFRESGRALLLGTASFWEGVDVPGDALRGLMIAKLPFRVPTDPLTAAQCEAIADRGGDPFFEYMLPNAALRLKQGFGRLVRSQTDRGVVVLCDPRVITKAYGESILATLPPATRVIDSWARARAAVNDFYRRNG